MCYDMPTSVNMGWCVQCSRRMHGKWFGKIKSFMFTVKSSVKARAHRRLNDVIFRHSIRCSAVQPVGTKLIIYVWLWAPVAGRRVRYYVWYSLKTRFNKHETPIRTQLNDQRRRFSLFFPVWTNRSAIAIDNVDNKSMFVRFARIVCIGVAKQTVGFPIHYIHHPPPPPLLWYL